MKTSEVIRTSVWSIAFGSSVGFMILSLNGNFKLFIAGLCGMILATLFVEASK